MYAVSCAVRYSQVDDFQKGCIGKGMADFPNYAPEKLKTPAEVLEYIKEHTRVYDLENYTFDSCDEVGRIDVEYLSPTHYGRPATKAQQDLWKQGKLELRLVFVSFYIEETVKPVTADWGKA